MRLGFGSIPAFSVVFSSLARSVLRRDPGGAARLLTLAPAWRPRLGRTPGGEVSVDD
jgi:hypothetical protein